MGAVDFWQLHTTYVRHRSLIRASLNAMKSYEETNWARLSPAFRAVHNRLRMARGKPPIPEPRVDLYVPPPARALPDALPFNPADPDEAIAAEAELRGLGDRTPDREETAKQLALELADWKNITKRLALELARKQLADRPLRTETLYRVIAKFVALAKKESGGKAGPPWSRQKIVGDAMRIYSVSERTVETAIANFPVEFYFTDGTKGHQVRGEGYLPIELRLLALGLPLPR